jgi:hypothetical protein
MFISFFSSSPGEVEECLQGYGAMLDMEGAMRAYETLRLFCRRLFLKAGYEERPIKKRP